MNAVIITIICIVLMNVPVLSCPTLTMCVHVQLELPEAIVKMVSHECMVFLCVYIAVSILTKFDCSSDVFCDADDLGAIENGMVTVSDTVFNSKANYSCDTGYVLAGDAIRTCQGSGLWSGSEPTCTGIYLIVF